MNRLYFAFLACLSASAAWGGWTLGEAFVATPRAFLSALQPQRLNLTIITADGQQHVVVGSWELMVFDSGTLTISYTSDRVFCDGFQPSNCAEVLP